MNTNKPPTITFITDSEKLSWIKNYKYNRNLPVIARQIYDFWLYRKLIKTFNLQDLYTLNELTDVWGFSKGLEMCILKVKLCISWREHIKGNEVRFLTLKAEYEGRVNNDKIHSYNTENAHENYLSPEELKVRNTLYHGGMMNIPENIILQQKIIEFGTFGDVKYWIFDKIYGCWIAVITSSHRERNNGKQGSIFLRDTNFQGLREALKIEIIKEQERQNSNKNKIKRINVQKVEEIMGLNNCNEELEVDDIF